MKKIKVSEESKQDSLSVLSYNINGLRAVLKKNIQSYFIKQSTDIIFLSETKTHEQTPISSLQSIYPHQYFNPSSKKGYSSTALLSKTKPIKVTYVLEGAPDAAGRCITAIYPSFCIIGLYVLNSGANLVRLTDRTSRFDIALINHLNKIKAKYGNIQIILCGDLNVAYLESDIYNPNEARNKFAGFTNIERVNFKKLLNTGLNDAWLYKHKEHLYSSSLEEKKKSYTWYSARGLWTKGGLKGWRLDYFLVCNRLIDKIESVEHDQLVNYSDHIPIILKLKDINK